MNFPDKHDGECIVRTSVSVCHSLMVSGLGRWCGGGCRTWRHEQLPEVIVGQLGPEVMHVVNTDAQVHTELHDHSAILTAQLLCGRPHHAPPGPEDWSNSRLHNKNIC